MTKAAFRAERINGVDCLVPCDDDGREIVASVRRRGKEVLVKTHVPRNPRHHRLTFAMLKHVTEAGAWDADTESLLAWLKIATGLVDTVVGLDGKVYYVPRSISFSAMPQDKFSRWFDRAVFILSTRLLGSDDWEELRDEIGRIVDGDLGERAREHDERFGGRAA